MVTCLLGQSGTTRLKAGAAAVNVPIDASSGIGKLGRGLKPKHNPTHLL